MYQCQERYKAHDYKNILEIMAFISAYCDGYFGYDPQTDHEFPNVYGNGFNEGVADKAETLVEIEAN